MRPVTIIDTLEGIKAQGIRSCVLLYSGGIDGSYFLDWAQQEDIHVVALTVGLEDSAEYQNASETAHILGAHHVFQNKTEQFLQDYASRAIHANAFYQGLYPISSSLSRPLMIKAAAELAEQMGIQAVAHTSTCVQNSAARFNFSLMTIDPTLTIVTPFLGSQYTRSMKLQRLQERNLTFLSGIHSVDSNIWGRVIESGTLENPENDLPPDGVFTWTKEISATPDKPEMLEIEFEQGLPTKLNGHPLSLLEMVQALNELGGRHGVGRFSGLEETTFGVKNHEVREAPAAHILISAHRELEMAILTQAEVSLKLSLDNQWTNLVVSGQWYAHLAEAIYAFIKHMNALVNGKVRLKLYKGNLIVLSKVAPQGLYYAGFEDAFVSMIRDISFSPLYNTMGISLLRRQPVSTRN
ncbi:MAG: argininosuccinate synthase [Ktedonobacteraceae bacterium]|nr:argininosuccinate synthase [Ktedonobacteraceae bacterium]